MRDAARRSRVCGATAAGRGVRVNRVCGATAAAAGRGVRVNRVCGATAAAAGRGVRDGSGAGDLRGRDRRLLGEVKRSRRAALGEVEDDLVSREDGMDQETIVANYLRRFLKI